MAGIVMCDRCERFGKGKALGGIAYRTNLADKEVESVHKELCPKCVKEFLDWLSGPPADGPAALSAGPFTEPYTPPDDGDGVQADTEVPAPERRPVSEPHGRQTMID